MLRRVVVCILSFGLGDLALRDPVFADEGQRHLVAQVQPVEMYKPTAMPDRIVLSWDGDPRTT